MKKKACKYCETESVSELCGACRKKLKLIREIQKMLRPTYIRLLNRRIETGPQFGAEAPNEKEGVKGK